MGGIGTLFEKTGFESKLLFEIENKGVEIMLKTLLAKH